MHAWIRRGNRDTNEAMSDLPALSPNSEYQDSKTSPTLNGGQNQERNSSTATAFISARFHFTALCGQALIKTHILTAAK